MKDKEEFLSKYGLSPETMLSLNDISNLCGISYNDLITVYTRGLVIEQTAPPEFSFHKVRRKGKVNQEKQAMNRVYRFLAGKCDGDLPQDSSGK
jgi:hypothetical protein